MTERPPEGGPGEPGRPGEDDTGSAPSERDPSGTPIAPGEGRAPSEPAPPAGPGYGPGGVYAPPTGQPAPAWQPPAAGQPPQPPPPGQPAPPAPPAGQPPPPAPPAAGYPPPVAWQPAGPARFGGHILASWGSRAAAFLLDSVFVLLAFVPAIVVLANHGTAVGLILLGLAFIWTTFLYAPVFMMRAGDRNGQSLGKQILRIRVVRQGGETMDFGWSLLRELIVKGLLIGMVGSFFLSIPVLLDYLWPLWDEQNRALHDMIVSTRVVEA